VKKRERASVNGSRRRLLERVEDALRNGPFGPADLGPEHRGNPLTGTKYDPAVKAARRQARRQGQPGASR
jgi:hypothetical protein